jgi:protein-histidine pros-kinase
MLRREAIHSVLHARREQRSRTGFVYASEERNPIHPELRALVESTGMAVLVCDGDGRIAFWNHAIAELFGYDFEEFGALGLGDLVPERLRAAHEIHAGRYLEHPRFRSIESGLVLVGRRREGSEFPVDVSLGPLIYADQPYVMASVRPRADPTE